MLKQTLCALCFLSLVACSSTKKNETDLESKPSSIITQKLATNFKRNGITLEWDCSWGTGFSQATCSKGNISAIEVTAYAPSFGNSEANREVAFGVAYDVALTKLNRFIQDDVSSSRVMVTMSKNIEKANDNIKSKILSEKAVSNRRSWACGLAAAIASGSRSKAQTSAPAVIISALYPPAP